MKRERQRIVEPGECHGTVGDVRGIEDGDFVPAPFRKCAAMAGLKMSSSSMASSSNLH